MDKKTLIAEIRKITGRKLRQLRSSGIIPANIYGKNVKSTAISVDKKLFEKTYREIGETGLLEIDLNKEKRPVLIHNLQKNPITGETIHIDFLQVDLKEKVTAKVPVEIVGEAMATKEGKGTVVQYIDELEVEALPTDLPEKFVVDVSGLAEVDQSIMVKDIKFDKNKVEVKTDLEQLIAKVEPLQKEEVVVPPKEETVPGEATPVEEAKVDETTVGKIETKPKE